MRSIITILCVFVSSSCLAQVYNHLYPVYKSHTDGIYTRQTVGYANEQGKLVIDYLFDGGDAFINGRTRASKDRKWGLIDTTGKWILPPIYTEMISWETEPYYSAHFYPDSLIVFDLDGHVICQGHGSYVFHYKELNRIIFDNSQPRRGGNGSSAMYTYNGQFVAEIMGGQVQALDMEGPYRKHPFVMQVSKGTFAGAILDTMGRILFDSVSTAGFYYGQMLLAGRNKVAVFDTNMKEIIPFSAGYTAIQRITHTSYFNVCKGGRYGIIDSKLNTIVDFIYDGQFWQADSVTYVVQDKKTKLYGYYNYAGVKLLERKDPVAPYALQGPYPVPINTPDGKCRLWKNGFRGPVYDYISSFCNNGVAYCYNAGQKYLIDTMGKIVLTLPYAFVTLPFEGVMAVGIKKNCPECEKYRCAMLAMGADFSYAQLFYLIDMKGKKISEDVYERLNPFLRGYAEVTRECKRYFMDKNGKKINENVQRQVSSIASGTCIVSKSGKRALADKNGKILSPWVTSITMKEAGGNVYTVYETDRASILSSVRDSLPDFQNGMVIYNDAGKYGLMDSTGRIVKPAQYTTCSIYGWYYMVTINGKSGLLNTRAQEIVPPKYESIQLLNFGVYVLNKKEGEVPDFLQIERNRK